MWQLAPHVHCTIVNGHAIFLDLARDRYFALPGDSDQTFQKYVAGLIADSQEATALHPLVNLGLLVKTDQPQPVETTKYVAPTKSVETPPHPTTREMISGIGYHLLAAADLKHRSLQKTIAHIQTRKAERANSEELRKAQDISELLAGPIWAKKIVSSQDQCLRCSVAIIHRLARHGYFPDLILGVRTRPFSAHAWVQADNLVLSDDIDSILPYTPILVV